MFSRFKQWPFDWADNAGIKINVMVPDADASQEVIDAFAELLTEACEEKYPRLIRVFSRIYRRYSHFDPSFHAKDSIDEHQIEIVNESDLDVMIDIGHNLSIAPIRAWVQRPGMSGRSEILWQVSWGSSDGDITDLMLHVPDEEIINVAASLYAELSARLIEDGIIEEEERFRDMQPDS